MSARTQRRLGWTTVVAGLVGAAAAVHLVVVEPAVTEDRYSYPLSPGGFAVARAGRWHGWHRFVPLALGLYVIVPMGPLLAASHDLARFGIGGWMLGFAALGWSLVTTCEAFPIDVSPPSERRVRRAGKRLGHIDSA